MTIPPELQRTLGDAYTIERPIGEGGMATVYLARDEKHGRQVALKVLRPELAASLGVERFRREIRIAASLSHPNILPLFDSGDSVGGGPLFFIMPFVEGDTLRTRLSRGPIALDQALRITIDVANALDYAHRHGIVHRDIKPENILLVDDHAVVTDFGIAHAVGEAGGDRLTRTGMVLGTPTYLSPEQVDGADNVDGRSDVFSLGAVLYEMLAGTAPFAAPTLTATLARVAEARIPPIPEDRHVPPELVAIVTHALARDRDERFATGREFGEQLNAFRAHLTVGTQTPTPRRIAWYGPAIAVVAIGAILLVMRARPAAASGDLPSVAILPFANESADTSDAYVGAGIAEELLNALGDVPGIRVAPRASSFAMASTVSARQIGQRLGVKTVLEGSVRRAAGTMRVTVRLHDVGSDKQIWSENIDEPAKAVFEVQERIARRIVQSLRGKLGVDTIVHRRTANPRAHDLVLRAAALFRERSASGAQTLAVAALLDTAESLDSTYADVPALQAVVFQSLAVMRDQSGRADAHGMSAGEMLRRAGRAARRAVALDSQSSAAHVALGQSLFRYDWDWAGAEHEIRKALALNPTSSSAFQQYTRVLRSMGRFDEARMILDSVAKYDPEQRRYAPMAHGRISFFSHDFARSIRENARADTSARTWVLWSAEALVAANRLVEAESLLSAHPRDSDPGRAMLLPLIAARQGRREEARRMIEKVRGTDFEFPPTEAAALVALGDTLGALAAVERGIATHDPLVVDYKVSPWLDPLRKHPRFIEAYRRLNFP